MGVFYDDNISNPIIAAVKDLSELDYALESPCSKIFLLTGNIFNLKEIASKVESKNKELYIYIESIDGFSKDTWGLEYIVKNIHTNGIITDKSSLVKLAKDMGIFTIQRVFVQDTSSLNQAIESIKHIRPSAVEILPGIIPRVINRVINETKISVIASGLITDIKDINNSLDAGATYISTSSKKLWNINLY